MTFSHADEVERLILMSGGHTTIDYSRVQLKKKGKVDHTELDVQYFLRKMKNENQIVDHKDDLRSAKKELRAFEETMEKELPNMKKFNELRSILQEMIENPKGKTRRHASVKRTKREKEELKLKLKQFQSENPNISIDALFSTTENDILKKKSHMKAFQSFKEYEFLKSGIKDPRKDASTKRLTDLEILQKQMEKQDPVFEHFKYPGL